MTALLAAILPSVVGGIADFLGRRSAQSSADRRAAEVRRVAIEDRDEARQYYLDTDATRFARVRDAALAGGYNPLTALQYGGTTMPGGELALPSGVGEAVAPVALGSYAADFARSLGDELTGAAALRREAEAVAVRLGQIEAERALAVPTGGYGPGGGFATPSAQVAGGGPMNVLRPSDVIGVTVAGQPVQPHLGWSDAEFVEQRYGDVASWVYGLGVLGADAWQSMAVPVGQGLADSWRHAQPVDPALPMAIIGAWSDWSNIGDPRGMRSPAVPWRGNVDDGESSRPGDIMSSRPYGFDTTLPRGALATGPYGAN